MLDESILEGLERVTIVSCGTSYHAGLLGRYAIEEWARMRVDVDVASEYRYRNPIVTADDLVVGITQSGETADTLAAMRTRRANGGRVLALTNAMGSQATRDADAVLYTRAGLEIGVAATKTFVCQVAACYLLALRLAELRGTLAPARIAELVGKLRRLPPLVEELLARVEPEVEAIAEWCWEAPFFLYIGRQAGDADRARGRAEAQGDLLRLDRRLRGRRDEARADRAARRADARGLRRDLLGRAAEGRAEHPGGAGARREGDRDHDRGRRRRSPRTPTRRSPCPRPTSCSPRCSR